ncbi:MAG: hypothetical protein COB30_009825 [Ectothiorhodospiraceae bacterium]|nr:hypothetical protein [Ectothiorhodospiraceae bacterium]
MNIISRHLKFVFAILPGLLSMGLFSMGLLAIGLLIIGTAPAIAANNSTEIRPFVPPAGTVKQPQGASIVPERFLRRWDPVTLFFSRNTGPDQAGAEDHPERYVKLQPAHPGAYTWINARTLQFRPAEPWPALGKFRWTAAGKTHDLTTLMEPPISTVPANQNRELPPVDTITLRFKEPVAVETLSRLVRIELRQLPGIDNKQSLWLDAEDFTIKVLERSQRSDPANYVLMLNEPIPGATEAIIHLRLSLDDGVEQSFKRIHFATAAPFRVKTFGCAGNRYPGAPGGVSYSRDQAISCNASNRSVEVEFSSALGKLGPVEARNMVRFTPAVKDLSINRYDKLLTISGKFETDTLYRLNLIDSPVLDATDRPLQLTGKHQLYFHFPAQPAFLAWQSAQGMMERYGPQMVPLKGRGYERLDLRIYPIDPLDRSFWPFPGSAVSVNEAKRPPGPGELPAPFTESSRHIYQHELSQHIQALGSPAISELVTLPLRKNGKSAKFGLDLKKHLSRINGKDKPGSYLVGIRRLDDSTNRAWIRVQVTDLSLTAIEESDTVHFVVTSINKGTPVRNANIELQGKDGNQWATIGSGTTDADGSFRWRAPGHSNSRNYRVIRRIVVSKRDDTLVLNPQQAPDQYANNQWSSSRSDWLRWTTQNFSHRNAKTETLCHLFTERPVYKPEDNVHIKGYIRQRQKNQLSTLNRKGTLVINGPGGREWRYPFTDSKQGSIYQAFDEKDLPTGTYYAHLEFKNFGRCGKVSFKKEAFRTPRFEVQLSSPDIVSLDSEFTVNLAAHYYAGGQVRERPVRWRVTQFPYAWTPKKREGFRYSSDGRFSGRKPFRATPLIQRETKTDLTGAAQISLDPTTEPTAQPRSYVIEATVTGDDDQTISTTRRILALPPVVLGLKAPTYLKQAKTITPEIIVAGSDGALKAGQEVNVKLSKRQWHSHLQAGDFSQGTAKYITEVVDEVVSETTITSKTEPVALELPLKGAGVYIIELETRDQLGRAQTVSVDFYAGGDQAVTWSRPPSRVFTVTPDKSSYVPGDTATLVLESPFQQARALAIVETPDGNQYHWLKINKGAATFELAITKHFVPRLPVHFVLIRGRNGFNVNGNPTAHLDLGKPATLAATTWVEVEPRDNRLDVTLKHPAKAQPGDEIDVTVTLSDPDGDPLSGEVTLWLVDQAVLALGKEQKLDPLPRFITSQPSRMTLRDTRNLAFGYLPFSEQPGGGVAKMMARAEGALLDNVTIRRNFQPVPYFNPRIMIDNNGQATLRIKLPDNLTLFKLRAKAVSGAERFGYAKSEVAVRLPIIVQPTLPRFVRPGDEFTAQAIGRIVEGDGGPGIAQINVDGLELLEENQKQFEWNVNKPQKIEFKVRVPTPSYDANGKPSHDTVNFTAAVERSADNARDAFAVTLPLRADRKAVIKRGIHEITLAEALELPAIEEPLRPGSLRRSVLLSDQPGLIRMAAGLNYLMAYPHGCTEQRISRARAYLSLDHFQSVLDQSKPESERKKVVNDTLNWVTEVLDDNGLAAYWPGSNGYVSLTAWVVQFLVEAQEAGYQVDEASLNRMINALQQALRSDYRHFITGESYTERSMALWALAASGRIDSSYAAELARKADYLNLESTAQVMRVLHKHGNAPEMLEELMKRLWDGLVFRLYQGKEIYGGLQTTSSSRNRLVLPSETRTLAELLRTLQRTATDNSRVQTLVDALVTLGSSNGWGNTNATVSALLALSDYMQGDATQDTDASKNNSADNQKEPTHKVTIVLDGKSQSLSLGGQHRMHSVFGRKSEAGQIQLTLADERPLIVRTETRYLPIADGSQVAPLAQGFAVQREWLKLLSADQPLQRHKMNEAGQQLPITIGDIIEEHVEVVNAEDRTYVAIIVPLAAGLEPMNPQLATAPAEAKPQGKITRKPTYTAYLDDHVAFYYDSLPKGNYHFYFRTRASIQGNFIQPPAYAELMYEEAVNGNSAGGRVIIGKGLETDNALISR